jgi:tRNA(fMet)-specific endonuclease VapC
MVALIDTCIFVAVERKHFKLCDTGLPKIRSKRERFVEDLLPAFAIIRFDLAVARVHAGLSARLAGSGIRVGEAALMVAATAISIGAPIATLDQRSFPRIPGVSLLQVKV